MQFSKCDLGHLNFIRATYICQSLARMGHQLSKLNDIPVIWVFVGFFVINRANAFEMAHFWLVVSLGNAESHVQNAKGIAN